MSDQFDDRGEQDLAALRAIGASIPGEPVVWDVPPSGLWDRIATATTPATSSGPMVTPTVAPPAGNQRPQTAVTSAPPNSMVSPLRRPARSFRRWIVPVTAVAAAVVAVAVAVGVVTNRSDDPDVLASTPLDPLGERGSGRAELVDDDGTLQLRLETAALDADDGFLEVWLIDPTVTRLVSLGPLRPDGVYDLPSGVDPAAFPIVDISIEPVDGDPTHSGNSVLRGQLPV